MRHFVAVFAVVTALAAGVFWYQNQSAPPVEGTAVKTTNVEPNKAEPAKSEPGKAEPSKMEPVKPQESVAQTPVASKAEPQTTDHAAKAEPKQADASAPQSPTAPNQTVGNPPSADVLTTLAPPPVDPNNPEDVVMVSRPALVMKGESSWDEGYQALVKAFARLNDEAKALNLKVSGRGVTVFVETNDAGFKFEAELPVASLPAQRPQSWPPELRLGATPEGKAIRFVHKGPYDEIDSTYEAITAYVDVKGIEAKETLIEEYISLGNESGDQDIELYIYVQPIK